MLPKVHMLNTTSTRLSRYGQARQMGALLYPLCCSRAQRSAIVVRVSSGDRFSKATAEALTQRPGEQQEQPDPFMTATLRLQKLLEDVSWDYGDQVRHEISNLPVEFKLTLSVNASTTITLLAIVISLATNEDPFGGMQINQAMLDHGALGLGFALPLVLCSFISRTPRMRQAFPVLDSMHDRQAKLLEPFVSGLNLPQLLILCSVVTLPMMMLLLPALHGGFVALGSALQSELLSPIGIHVPGPLRRDLATLLPAVLGSYFGAWVVTRQLSVKRGEFQAIKDAMDNSDRYFRLSESMNSKSGDTAQLSEKTSNAFKAVSVVWLLMRKKVCQLSYVLSALNICYLAIIWHETQDLSTPVAAGIVAFGAELYLSQRALSLKSAARKKVAAEEQRTKE